MKTSILLSPILAAAVTLVALSPAGAGELPKKVGDCTTTRIAELGSRLEGVPDSGSAVSYENGGVGISYDVVPALRRSRVGDSVKLCLTSIPQDCPAGDERGKTYSATNLRTKGSWELPDSEHMCGGA